MKKFLISCGAASAAALADVVSRRYFRSASASRQSTAAGTPRRPTKPMPVRLTGKVSFTGDKPVMKNISMDATPACARARTTAHRSRRKWL